MSEALPIIVLIAFLCFVVLPMAMVFASACMFVSTKCTGIRALTLHLLITFVFVALGVLMADQLIDFLVTAVAP